MTGVQTCALPISFREDFRESLYRLVGALTATGVTVFMILEAISTSPDVGFTGERVSFITDDIIVQRYVEVDGTLAKVVSVIKMRGSAHSSAFRRYQISDKGATIGDPVTDIDGLLTGSPTRRVVDS